MKLGSREEIVNFIMAAAQYEEQDLQFQFEEPTDDIQNAAQQEDQELSFQLDEADIQNALDNVREVARAARASSPDKKRRRKSNGGKKRGPKPSKVAIISYHLPEMWKIPKNFKLQNAEVTRHMENGYGFRKID